MKIHIVQKGDTLWEIAKKYGVNFEELKVLNSQLSNPEMIMPGMKIKVPTTGGHIKKEAPIVGHKKEIPIANHKIVKEKPITKPVQHAPKKEHPIKEVPKKEVPIKEKPYTPKMPTPIIPEIDINNYYSMKMTNVDVDVDVDVEEKPTPAPIAPPKQEYVVQPTQPVQQEPCPPIVPYQPYCYDVSPMMPGSGFPPGVCPPEGVPLEQVQQQPIQTQTQAYPTPLPGVTTQEYQQYQQWEESSSSYDKKLYHQGYEQQHQHQQVPQEYYQQPLVQYGQMPVENGVAPTQYPEQAQSYPSQQPYPFPAAQAPMQMPFQEDCGCGGPTSYQQPSYPTPEAFAVEGVIQPGYGAYPQVGGFGGMNQGFPPQGGMWQSPQGFPPNAGGYPGFPQPFQQGIPQGFGPFPQPNGGEMYGYSDPSFQQPNFQGGMGNGATPFPYPVENEQFSPFQSQAPTFEAPLNQQPSPEVAPPAYGPGGNAPVYSPPIGSNISQPPFMNPYGFNQGTPFGMPRYQEDESSDL